MENKIKKQETTGIAVVWFSKDHMVGSDFIIINKMAKENYGCPADKVVHVVLRGEMNDDAAEIYIDKLLTTAQEVNAKYIFIGVDSIHPALAELIYLNSTQFSDSEYMVPVYHIRNAKTHLIGCIA